MVIAAYLRTKSADINEIKKESPVNDHCGTRLAIPLMLIILSINSIKSAFDLNDIATYIVLVILVECMLWIDVLRGFDRIPVFSHLSHIIQKYIVTKYPGEYELRIAQVAMQTLIDVHNNTTSSGE